MVVGDMMLDHYIWGSAYRVSPEAPVPIIHVEQDTYSGGGAANVAFNIVAMGATCETYGWLGKDSAGRQLGRLLKKQSVAFDKNFFSEGAPTIQKTRIMVKQQQVGRVDREAAPEAYRLTEPSKMQILEERAAAADALIFSDYGKGVISTELVRRLQAINQKNGGFVAMDPKPLRLLKHQEMDLLTPNREESLLLAQITATPQETFPEEAVCKRIWEKYRPRLLVVTLGAEGMLLSQKGHIIERVPTSAREVFDVSGAGDTVIAALTLGLKAGAVLEEAANLANVAAGIVVGKLGTAAVSKAEILAYQ